MNQSEDKNKPITKQLNHQLITAILVFTFFITTAITALSFYLDYNSQIEHLDLFLEDIHKNLVPEISKSKSKVNNKAIQSHFKKILKNPNVEKVFLTTPDKNNIYPEDQTKLIVNKYLTERKFVLIDTFGAPTPSLGTLHIVTTEYHIYRNLMYKSWFVFYTQAIKTTIIAFFMLYLFHNMVTRHVIRFSDFFQKINTHITEKSNIVLTENQKHINEIGVLEKTIHTTFKTLISDKTSGKNSYLQVRINSQRRAEKMAILTKFICIEEIARNMIHEINNPLQIIFTSFKEIQKQLHSSAIDKAKVSLHNQKVESALNKFTQIIRRERSYTRTGKGDPLVTLPVTEIIQDVLDLCETRIVNHGIRLSSDTSKLDPNTFIKCRRVATIQAIGNILANSRTALKTTIMPWIKITTIKRENRIEVAIEDNGAGIREDIREKIWKPFFTTYDNGKHPGIGLNMAKKVLKENFAHLYFDENSLETRFVISFLKAKPIKTGETSGNTDTVTGKHKNKLLS